MILDIKTFPDKVLRKKAVPVTEFNGELSELLDNMIETMHSSIGVGLAAPQVGVSKRILVIDTTQAEEDGQLLRIINPEIVHEEGEELGEEGCLSVPGEYEAVRRAAKGYRESAE